MIFDVIHSPNQNTPPVRLLKAHADLLAHKAGSYYKAKCKPGNYCREPQDVPEGRELLQAFDEAVDEGMDPQEGTTLITKCAGSMGTAMSGPLAATLATRPVKQLANATGMDARAIAKSYVHTHTRTLNNGKVIVIGQYNNKKLTGPQHPKGSISGGTADISSAEAEAKPYTSGGDLDLDGLNDSERATVAKDAIHALTNYKRVLEHHHTPAGSDEVGLDVGPGLDTVAADLADWQSIHDHAVEQMHSPAKLGGSPEKGSGHYAMVEGKAKYVPGEAPVGTAIATIGHKTALGENKTKGWYLRATNKAEAKIVQEAYYKVTGDTAPEMQQSGSSNHFGKEGGFPHIFFGSGEENKKLAIAVLAEVHRMHPAEGPDVPAAKDDLEGFATFKLDDTVVPQESAGPEEGDQEDGLTFHGGRWHNDKDKPEGSDKNKHDGKAWADESYHGKQWSVLADGSAIYHDGDWHDTNGSNPTEAVQDYLAKHPENDPWAPKSHVPDPDDLPFDPPSSSAMPTVDAMKGIGGKEWEKNGKHRIYFNAKDHLQKGLSFPGGKVWYDFADKKLHTKDLGVSADAVTASIKEKASLWASGDAIDKLTGDTGAASEADAIQAGVDAYGKDIKEGENGETAKAYQYLNPSAGGWDWMDNLKWMASKSGSMEGTQVQVRWTGNHEQHSAKGTVVTENKSSFVVELDHDIYGKDPYTGKTSLHWKKGTKIKVPSPLAKGASATWGNGIFPTPEGKAEIKGKPEMDGNAAEAAMVNQEVADTEAGWKVSQNVLDRKHMVGEAIDGTKASPSPGAFQDASYHTKQLATEISENHPEAGGHASNAAAYSVAAHGATNKAKQSGEWEDHQKAAGHHGKAGLIHAQLGDSLKGNANPIAPGPAHLQPAHAMAAKGHALLADYHTKEAEKLKPQAAPAPANPPAQAVKHTVPFHERGWDAVLAPMKDKAGQYNGTADSMMFGGSYKPTKADLEDFVVHATHAAVVAMHKHKAGVESPFPTASWEKIAKNYAEKVHKAKKVLKEAE